jgi:hypothetical protein
MVLKLLKIGASWGWGGERGLIFEKLGNERK